MPSHEFVVFSCVPYTVKSETLAVRQALFSGAALAEIILPR
jgi:hypothetical protein